jgi:hypothetical protein
MIESSSWCAIVAYDQDKTGSLSHWGPGMAEGGLPRWMARKKKSMYRRRTATDVAVLVNRPMRPQGAAKSRSSVGNGA